MLCSIFLEMSLDFATLTSVKKVRNLQHENLPIQDINFPTKNSKSPDLGSRMYHMYAGGGGGGGGGGGVGGVTLPHPTLPYGVQVGYKTDQEMKCGGGRSEHWVGYPTLGG